MKRSLLDKKAVRYAMLLIGVLLMAASYNLFFIPNRIAPGGFSGIGMVLYYQFGWPVGVITLVMNVPLYIFAVRENGLGFIAISAVATVIFSLAVDIAPIYRATDDMLLSCVYGGVLLGVGLGMVLRSGGSTGGTDMLARLLGAYFPSASIGSLLLLIECAIVAVSALAFGVEEALYAAVALAGSSKLVDIIQEGLNAAKAYLIISSHHEEIAERVMGELKRGATSLKCGGMYSGKDYTALICVIYRAETGMLKSILREIDPYAFVIVCDVREALGEGFSPIVRKNMRLDGRSHRKRPALRIRQ